MSKKIKYVFDHNSLTFKIKKHSLKDRIKNISFSVGFGLVMASVFIVLFYMFIDSPEEKILKRQLNTYEMQYKQLNLRVKQMSEVLEDIEDRDDNVYRMVFMSEPFSKEKRNQLLNRNTQYEELFTSSNSDLIINTTKQVDELTQRLYAQSISINQVFEMAKNKKERALSIPAILPLDKKKSKLSSGFGYRFHPILQIKRMHTGIDFTAKTGTAVYATADGVVVESDRSSGYGNLVTIDHGYGFKTLYAHLSKFNTTKGKKVKRGDIIGYVGSTGLSQTPHLHYEVHQNNRAVNPVMFFFNDLSAEEYEEVLELASKENQSLS